jgi:hypothetical protein
MKKQKEFRLPRRFAEKWLEALRSGKYNQAKETLYDKQSNSYCCLGLACRLEYPLRFLESREGYAETICKSDDGHGLKLNLHKIPKELRGRARDNDLVGELTGLNDDGFSFGYIADWIEENVELYN